MRPSNGFLLPASKPRVPDDDTHDELFFLRLCIRRWYVGGGAATVLAIRGGRKICDALLSLESVVAGSEPFARLHVFTTVMTLRKVKLALLRNWQIWDGMIEFVCKPIPQCWERAGFMLGASVVAKPRARIHRPWFVVFVSNLWMMTIVSGQASELTSGM